MAAFQGPKLGAALCEALDLDASVVTGITIRCRVGEVPTVTVRSYMREDEALVEVFKKYELRDPNEED